MAAACSSNDEILGFRPRMCDIVIYITTYYYLRVSVILLEKQTWADFREAEAHSPSSLGAPGDLVRAGRLWR